MYYYLSLSFILSVIIFNGYGIIVLINLIAEIWEHGDITTTKTRQDA